VIGSECDSFGLANIPYDDNQCEQFSKHELQMSHQSDRIMVNGGNNCNEKERQEIVASQTVVGSHPYQKQKMLENDGTNDRGIASLRLPREQNRTVFMHSDGG
jgi:hypothetical protein